MEFAVTLMIATLEEFYEIPTCSREEANLKREGIPNLVVKIFCFLPPCPEKRLKVSK